MGSSFTPQGYDRPSFSYAQTQRCRRLLPIVDSESMELEPNARRAGDQVSATTSHSSAAVPSHIGKYEVETENGRGTVVRMFRARDRDTGRRVTLKLLAGGRDRRLADLFRREIAIAAGLRHKNIVAIYELGDHAGLPFAATQF